MKNINISNTGRFKYIQFLIKLVNGPTLKVNYPAEFQAFAVDLEAFVTISNVINSVGELNN